MDLKNANGVELHTKLLTANYGILIHTLFLVLTASLFSVGFGPFLSRAAHAEDLHFLSSETVQYLRPVTPLESRRIRARLGNALVAGRSLHPGVRASAGQFAATEECQQFIQKLPAAYQRGYLEVPEDWSNPSGRKIKVFYYTRIPASGDLGGRDPVVFFNGGPGGDSHSSYEILEKDQRGEGLAFVYLDQRGTGCSQSYPTDETDATVHRLAHYGSRSIVLDAEAIRVKILGESRGWKIFGQSYGGYIAHRYAQVAPRRVLGIFAHGASLMDDQVEWMKLRIESQHRVVEDYFTQYPADREEVRKIQAQIPETQCFSDATAKICGPKVLDASVILLGFRDSWSSLHEWLGALLDDSGKVNQSYLTEFVRSMVFGVYNENGFAAAVISKLEMENGVSTIQGCEGAEKRLREQGQDPESWTFNECRLLVGLKASYDPLIERMRELDPLTLDVFSRALSASPSLRFSLYSGKKDVFVPYESFREEVTRMGGRIKYTQFPESGHDGFYSEAQVWRDLNAPSRRSFGIGFGSYADILLEE